MKKLTTNDKAALVICLFAIVMFVICAKGGKTKTSLCFLLAAFGGAAMVYANHRVKNKKA